MSVITVKKENISLEIIFWRCLWCRFVYDRNEFPPQVFGKIVITGDIPIPYFSLVDNYNGDGFQDLYFEIDIWTTTYHPVKKVTYLVFLKSCYMDVFLRFSQFPKTVFVRICWCCLSSCDDVDRWGKLGNKACEVESLLSIGKEDGLRQATYNTCLPNLSSFSHISSHNTKHVFQEFFLVKMFFICGWRGCPLMKISLLEADTGYSRKI